MNDLNPSLSLSDEGVDSILRSLQSVRDRALSKSSLLSRKPRNQHLSIIASACRACIFALHTEVSRLIEVQHAFRQLSYFDLKRRFRLTVELTRIAISLPIALEQAIVRQKEQNSRDDADTDSATVLNARVRAILHGSAVVLTRLERFLN